MKIVSLFVVRHGHSNFEASSDFQRTLNFQGLNAAIKTAKFISETVKKYGLSVDECICSAAVRTQQTADTICNYLNVKKINSYQQLYATVSGAWLDIIEKTSSKCLILVGHNPTMSQLNSLFSGENHYMSPADCGYAEIEISKEGVIAPALKTEYFKND